MTLVDKVPGIGTKIQIPSSPSSTTVISIANESMANVSGRERENSERSNPPEVGGNVIENVAKIQVHNSSTQIVLPSSPKEVGFTASKEQDRFHKRRDEVSNGEESMNLQLSRLVRGNYSPYKST